MEDRIEDDGDAGGTPPASFARGLSPRRSERIRKAVRLSVARRAGAVADDAVGAIPPAPPDHAPSSQRPFPGPSGLLAPALRARLQGNVLPQVSPAMMRRPAWKASPLAVFWRLVVYTGAGLRWLSGNAVDKILRRDHIDRRAVRLRRVIERIGGAAVKLGQQMAMRIDLVPYEYTAELSKMLDRMPPFPFEQARAILERRLGKPVEALFDVLDETPIGSASLACVYQAYLKTGERVAVKVRRPGIAQVFVTDCAALSLVLRTLEFLTVLRPGLSSNFVHEFRTMLLDEADFSDESRNTELFRRRVEKNLKHITAPRTFPEFGSEETLVTEFVGGIWLRELIVAVENKDEAALAELRSHGIEPDVVAKRLLRANHFGMFESLLYHADPHPSNVVVQKGGRVVFIDFGSCGAYTTRERLNWRQLVYYHNKEDIGRMVQAALAILEPLPPIDVDEFTKRVEMVFWQDLYAFKSSNAAWWERTSARIWINFLALAREYGIPLNLNTLRMIRSTLLYETIAARLYPRVSNYREHRRYSDNAGKRARKRVRNRLHRWLLNGPSDADYIQVEQFMDMGNRVFYLAQRWLDAPPFRFSMLIDKAVYGTSVLVRGALSIVALTLVAGGALLSHQALVEGRPFAELDFYGACWEVLHWHSFQLLTGILILLDIRRIMFRFFDKDIDNSATGLT